MSKYVCEVCVCVRYVCVCEVCVCVRGCECGLFLYTHQSLDVITRTAIHPKESPHHADYCGRVKELVGFEFPPVMSQYLELMVHNHWARWRREG